MDLGSDRPCASPGLSVRSPDIFDPSMAALHDSMHAKEIPHRGASDGFQLTEPEGCERWWTPTAWTSRPAPLPIFTDER